MSTGYHFGEDLFLGGWPLFVCFHGECDSRTLWDHFYGSTLKEYFLSEHFFIRTCWVFVVFSKVSTSQSSCLLIPSPIGVSISANEFLGGYQHSNHNILTNFCIVLITMPHLPLLGQFYLEDKTTVAVTTIYMSFEDKVHIYIVICNLNYQPVNSWSYYGSGGKIYIYFFYCSPLSRSHQKHLHFSSNEISSQTLK